MSALLRTENRYSISCNEIPDSPVCILVRTGEFLRCFGEKLDRYLDNVHGGGTMVHGKRIPIREA